MRRSIKAVFVVIGWIVVYCVAILLVTPVIMSFQDPLIQDVPLESIIPALIMAVGVGIPIMYGAIVLIAPLIFATIELFEPES